MRKGQTSIIHSSRWRRNTQSSTDIDSHTDAQTHRHTDTQIQTDTQTQPQRNTVETKHLALNY